MVFKVICINDDQLLVPCMSFDKTLPGIKENILTKPGLSQSFWRLELNWTFNDSINLLVLEDNFPPITDIGLIVNSR